VLLGVRYTSPRPGESVQLRTFSYRSSKRARGRRGNRVQQLRSEGCVLGLSLRPSGRHQRRGYDRDPGEESTLPALTGAIGRCAAHGSHDPVCIDAVRHCATSRENSEGNAARTLSFCEARSFARPDASSPLLRCCCPRTPKTIGPRRPNALEKGMSTEGATVTSGKFCTLDIVGRVDRDQHEERLEAHLRVRDGSLNGFVAWS
jgi:hypothetical protein